ncbi:MAG: GIY-YIG nuclease family protein [Thiotrichales bacterium]|nr:MAG: GIY-YIG nuclease family protein [Thiotrichales bacterium]
MIKQPTVYILTNRREGTLYIGVTSNLSQRIWQHKNNLVSGFSSKYNLHKLVYFEVSRNMESAIQYEKQLKKWNRQWKIELIEEMNPEWKDLYPDIV